MASINGADDIVALLARSADVNIVDMNGWTPQQTATYRHHTSIIARLLDAGANVNAVTPQSRQTALHVASVNGADDIVALLLAHSADVNAVDVRGWTPLLSAAQHSHAAVVARLLDAGANVNAVTPQSRQTALHVATINGADDIVALLLARGAEVNAVDVNGWTPLVTATHHRHVAVVARVLDAGANVNTVVERSTALHMASMNGADDIVALLLARGADVNAVDVNGWTPLQVATHHRHVAVVARLLDAGANVNTAVEGSTALHMASVSGADDVVALLLARGAVVNAVDVNGWTPLVAAMHHRHAAVVARLLDAGAETKRGFAPLNESKRR